jgi:hypothetical protein
MTAEPIEHCYWGVPGKFLAGEYPRNLDPHSSARKIKALWHDHRLYRADPGR